MSDQNGWIGVDLDGTLAVYDGWKGPDHIGEPIPKMVERVRLWVSEGRQVKIFTARVASDLPESYVPITNWMLEVFGFPLPITCKKDYGMIELWDDRAVQLIPNTGHRADGSE